jgi:RHS repeat-associated protein
MARFVANTSLVIAVVVSFFLSADGQTTMGIASFQVRDVHEYDNINLVDLGVLLTVPVRHKAGIIPFSHSLIQQLSTYKDYNGIMQPAGSTFYPTTAGFGTVSYVKAGGCYGNIGTIYSDWWVYDETGGRHPLPDVTPGVHFQVNSCGTVQTYTDSTTDGSGYTLVVTTDTNGGMAWSLYSVSGRSTRGTNFSVSNSPIITKLTDTNGNYITQSAPNGYPTTPFQWTDSMNTQVMSDVYEYDSNDGYRPSTFTYPDSIGNGHQQAYTIHYTSTPLSWDSGAGCPPGYAHSKNFPTGISLPDGSSLTFTYDSVPNNPGYTTGRVASIGLPSGGTISYAYSGGGYGYGINCSDGTTATMTRTTSEGVWTYSHTPGPFPSTTTVTDPFGNEEIYTFVPTQKIPYDPNNLNIYPIVPISIQSYDASHSLTRTTVYCYNGNTTNCSSSYSIAFPITQRDTYTYLPGLVQPSRSTSLYNSNLLLIEQKDYDFGGSSPISDTVYQYGTYSNGACNSIGNYIQDHICTVQIKGAAGNVLSQTNNTYDAHGNLLSASQLVSGSTYLTTSYTYNANGTLLTKKDANVTVTTYSNTACNNTLNTSTTTAGLTESVTWDCNGGVQTSTTDANGQIVKTSYNDPLWRITSQTDALSNVTSYSYGVGGVYAESSLLFNGGKTIVDNVTTVNGLGKTISLQAREGPGSTLYDTVSHSYDSGGRLAFVSQPCAAARGSVCPGTAGWNASYDALSRPSSLVDSAQPPGQVIITYIKNDVLTSIAAPSGENAKRRQVEYDGLGRPISVCEITSAAGSGSCSQNNPQTGYFTKYTYDPMGRLTGVTQNAQSASPQTRSFSYDGLSRLTSETNPESGTRLYFYDSAPATPGVACPGQSPGDLVKAYDANGNTTCIIYDALHRVTQITYPGGPNSSVTPAKFFAYDTPYSGSTGTNIKGRLVAAGTCQSNNSCAGNAVVVEEFGYSTRGELTDVWETTPHSIGTYHTTASYWTNGVLNTLGGVPGQTVWTFGVDGEGRPSTAVQGSTNLVSATSFNAASQPLTVTMGLGDTDTYGYDPKTGRMGSYTFTVGSTPKSIVGNLTWNPNGTLSQLAITDGFNAGGTQTCKYGDPSSSVPGYDDLGRLVKVDCGASVWQQNFSYDPFGNLTKTVPTGGTGIAWNPGYNAANNRYNLAGTSYDANGNLLTDTFHTYTWNAEGHPATIDSSACGSNGTCGTYDAFGRIVEKNVAGAYTQFLYSPVGKLGLMNGQSLVNAYIPLPGGETYNIAPGYARLWHKDWLGTVRLSSMRGNRSVDYDRAFAPFGEVYKNFGSTGNINFTGDTQDTVPGTFDTQSRELNPLQGRWISPDRVGLSAADVNNPQTWNLYAYALNNPLVNVDPVGEDGCDVSSDPVACILTYFGWDPSLENVAGNFSDPFTASPLGNDGTNLLWNLPFASAGQQQQQLWGLSSTWDTSSGTTAQQAAMDLSTTPGPRGQHWIIPSANGVFYCPLSNCHTLNGLFPPMPMSPYGGLAAAAMGYGAVEGMAVALQEPELPLFTGKPTTGVLVTDVGDYEVSSGRVGPTQNWVKPLPRGYNWVNKMHAEGQAIAIMNEEGITEADLYINNPRICGWCKPRINKMLAPGSQLTVHLPDGTTITFVGLP